MNGRKAKLLRRKAEQQTIGHPETEYEGYEVKKEVTPGNYVRRVIVKLTDACTRGVYKKLKREYLA